MSGLDLPRVARTLSEIAHVLASADDPQGRIRRVLVLLADLVPYERCALFESETRQGRLVTVPDAAPLERRELHARLHRYYHLVAEGDQAGRIPREPPAGESATPGRAHLALPVAGMTAILGVLFVERAGDGYAEHGVRFLSIVAAQLGGYLTTLRLRRDELEHARQLGIALHRLQETDRRKDEFLAMLGHELRNPLGAINLALRVMDLGGGDGDPNAKYHRIIDRQLNHLSRIVDELLDASRVRLGKIVLKRERVDLRSVVRRWMEAFGAAERVQEHALELDLPEEPVEVDGDPVRLEQVLSNLLTNALKFTPSGGSIRVTVLREKAHGVLRVKDGGIGMTPDVIARAFDLFAQANDSLVRSEGGIGLGLSLVRGLVERHGGTIEGFSEGPGRGSEFVVRLPLLEAGGARQRREEEAEAPTEPAGEAPEPLLILIVEDHDDARKMLETLLDGWGHRHLAARDGLEGVALALAERPDAALVDIGLPGLDGLGVARRIRGEPATSRMTLIAMTGYGLPEDRRRALDAGFDGYMVKPIDEQVLQERLAAIRRSERAPPMPASG